MKKIKSLILAAKELSSADNENLNIALWNLICYSPRMPLRLHQQELLEEASTFQVQVYDEHFNQGRLQVNGFKWGNGSYKVLLTHGWGSKALDFHELITVLKEYEDLEIYAFDAPGNGSSEGELTNLLLYVEAIKSVIAKFGMANAFIGHSLGAMANILAVSGFKSNQPPLLVSIAPLIKLKEHFVSIMTNVNASEKAQNEFFRSFQSKFNVFADTLNLDALYSNNLKHFLAYDPGDTVSPHKHLIEFLSKNPEIKNSKFDNIGHEKMHKDAQVIGEVVKFIMENRVS